MAKRNIILSLDEHWYDALEQQTRDGLQKRMEEYISGLLIQFPARERERIEREIENARLPIPDQLREVVPDSFQPRTMLRVKEHRGDVCFRIAQPVGILSAAVALNNSLKDNPRRPSTILRSYFADTEESSPWMYGLEISDCMANSGLVAAVYSFDYDLGEFAILEAGQDWHTWSISDVREAVSRAGSGPDAERLRRFRTALAEKELLSEKGLPFLHGARNLTFQDIAQSDKIVRDGPLLKLQFYGARSSEEVFGIHESVGTVTASAVYDLEIGKLADTLEVSVQRNDGEKKRFAFHISEDELERIRVQMNALCARDFHRDMESLHLSYIQEQAELRLSVFHITEHGESNRILVAHPLDALTVAGGLRSYGKQAKNNGVGPFRRWLPNARALSLEEYERYIAERLNQSGRVVGAFDIDLDRGEFAEINSENRWMVYRIGDVSTAAYHANRRKYVPALERENIFRNHLDGKALIADVNYNILRGFRTLRPEEIAFAEGVTEERGILDFCMEAAFSSEEVLGISFDEGGNNDYANYYAYYNLESGRICDSLTVMLWHKDATCRECEYHLSAEEQAILLPEMDMYCQEQSGMTLAEWREQYFADQHEPIANHQPAQGQQLMQ